MLCHWAGDLQDRSALSLGMLCCVPGQVTCRTVVYYLQGQAVSGQLLVMQQQYSRSERWYYLPTSQHHNPEDSYIQYPFSWSFSFFLFFPFHTSYSPLPTFSPLSFFLVSPFPQQTTSVSADHSQPLFLRVHNCCQHSCLLIRPLDLDSIWRNVLTHSGHLQATLHIKQIQLDA